MVAVVNVDKKLIIPVKLFGVKIFIVDDELRFNVGLNISQLVVFITKLS